MEKLTKYLFIQGDYNDGDYVSSKYKITDDDLQKIKEIVSVLKATSRGGGIRWETGDNIDKHDPYSYARRGILTIDEVELLNNYTPSHEHGIHTIDKIEVIYQGERLL
jgi:hypothetical protein